MLFYCELVDNLNVCMYCDYYFVIILCECFVVLFDGGVFNEVKVFEFVVDLL